MYEIMHEIKINFSKIELLIYMYLIKSIDKILSLIKTKNRQFECRRVLVISYLGGIGDFMMRTPVFVNLKKNYPEIEIYTIITPTQKEIVETNKQINDYFIFDSKKFITSVVDLMNWINDKRIDGMIYLDPTPKMQFLLTLYKIDSKKFGYLYDYKHIEGTNIVTKKEEKITIKEKENVTLRNLEVIKNLGCKIIEKEYILNLTKKDRECANKIVQKIKKKNKKIIVINPNVQWLIKAWPQKNYVKLIMQLLKEINCQIILIGGKNDRRRCKEIKNEINGILDLSGKLTLREFAALLDQSDLFITADTGPMHIGYATKVKMISLFGPTSPTSFGPATTLSRLVKERGKYTIYKQVSCNPCIVQESFYPNFEKKCKKNVCMNAITTEEVLRLAKRILK